MKKIKMLIAMMLAVIMLVPTSACITTGGEAIDTSKTQLYVGNFDGGYGTKWMDELERRFEEKYANFSFEEGKKGIQVLVDNKKSYTADDMLNVLAASDREVLFVSGQKFYKMLDANLLMDISDIVKVNNIQLHGASQYADEIASEVLTYARTKYNNHDLIVEVVK